MSRDLWQNKHSARSGYSKPLDINFPYNIDSSDNESYPNLGSKGNQHCILVAPETPFAPWGSSNPFPIDINGQNISTETTLLETNLKLEDVKDKLDDIKTAIEDEVDTVNDNLDLVKDKLDDIKTAIEDEVETVNDNLDLVKNKLDDIKTAIENGSDVETLSVAWNRNVRIDGWQAITGRAYVYGWAFTNAVGNANLQLHFHDAVDLSGTDLNDKTPFQLIFVRPSSYSEYHTKPLLVENGLFLFATANETGTINNYSTNPIVGAANVNIYYVPAPLPPLPPGPPGPPGPPLP